MMFIHQLSLILCLICSTSSLQWAGSHKNGETMYACVGDEVMIPWNYSLEVGDEVLKVKLVFKEKSREQIIFSTQVQACPTTIAPFTARQTHVTSGSIRLRHVTFGDSGQYDVIVEGRNAISDDSLEQRHAINLMVSDKLHTRDGQLHVIQPQAVVNQTTLKASLVLSCGQFIFVDQPVYPVEWLTPSGAILSSSVYNNGYWNLLLPAPVEVGTYVCRVPQRHMPSTCLHDNQVTSVQASVTLNTLEVKLTLMEAELTALRSHTQNNLTSMSQELTNVNQDVNSLSQDLTNVNQDLNTMSQDLTSMSQDLTSVNQDMTSMNQDLTSMGQDLTTVNRGLVSVSQDLASVSGNLTTQIQNIRERENGPRVAFFATLSNNTAGNVGARLIFKRVVTNIGSGYDPTTGIFKAPVSGLYVFSGAANPSDEPNRADFGIDVDNGLTGLAYAYSTEGGQFQTGSCQVVVHMNKDQTASMYVFARRGGFAGHAYKPYTTFGGFLLEADP